MRFFSKLFGDGNERQLRAMNSVVDEINRLENDLEVLSDEELRASAENFRSLLRSGEALEDILPRVFASVREAARRTLSQRHYDEQLICGIVLHRGNVAEMRTGEGKTLAATLPLALHALEEKGAHLVTVNDYLARRDTVWMGRIYHALGFTVACINGQAKSYRYDPTHAGDAPTGVEEFEEGETASFEVEHEHLRPVSREEAYGADITYGTNAEFGFDYLRDNLALKPQDLVQRDPHYVIIDEVDSVLIDEARTPLIISSPDERSSELYRRFAKIMPRLKEDVHYIVDEKTKAATLTDEGIDRVERLSGMGDLYGEKNAGVVHYLDNALRAYALFRRDQEYVVRDGEIVIVDEFTGRMMPGRRYSGGLHQAIEAKEGVEVQKESRTVASISIQNLFRMYPTLSGMTGTAKSSEEEFAKVYGLDVVVIPTHEPLIRRDHPDRVYKTQVAKFRAVAEEAKSRNDNGQPVLIGTVSIEKNEVLSQFLRQAGVSHEVLNAKNHEQEARIIAQAGRLGGVTVATNLAGRGVDIILGGNPPDSKKADFVKEAGGLHVIGTERHEARRIDDQLRGRAGRQGDPGSSQFFVSFDDDIMRRMGGERLQGLMGRFHVPDDQPIEHGLITRAIERAQNQVEGYNFDVRKHLLEYDDVMNRQREAIYRRRRRFLMATHGDHDHSAAVRQELFSMIEEETSLVVAAHTAGDVLDWTLDDLLRELDAIAPLPSGMKHQIEGIRTASDKSREERQEEITEMLASFLKVLYEAKAEALGGAASLERQVFLRAIDFLWMDHLDAMEHLRESVRLRAYGQRDPLVEYKREGREMFDDFLVRLRANVVRMIFRVGVSR